MMATTKGLPQAYYELVSDPVIDAGGHAYHGVCRDFFAGVNWDESPAKDDWKQYVCAKWEDLGEWDAFFPTLDIARDFQRRFRSHGYHPAILAVYPCESASVLPTLAALAGYLGLDVATTEPLSVLRPEWVWDDSDYRSDPNHLAVLWALPPKYFRGLVNQWGLLSRYEDAALYRDVMHALATIDPSEQTPTGLHVMAIQDIGD